MPNPKIFVFAPADQSADSHERMEKFGCELTIGKAGWHTPQGDNEADMIAISKDCDALMGTSIRSSPITRNIMAANPDLRIVAKCTVGTDDIDVAAATEMGILVCHAPTESNCYGVAEGTVAMMLARMKQTVARDRTVKGGEWRDPSLMGRYLGKRETDDYPGLTLGIIGLGRIGSRVCELMAPWRMRIIACDPYVPDEKFIRFGAEKVDLDTLLAESDIVSMHCVATPETRELMNAGKFAKMKPDAVFINTSRGANVDETALAEALDKDVIAGAAIDAFQDEPISTDSPLRGLGDKITLSAHMVSSNVGSGIGPGYRWATQAVLKALSGEVPNNVFNPEVIERWKERFEGKKALTVNEPVVDHPGYGPPIWKV
ncbi:MAG: NAD(P)-dependent oxidoreductase [Alphaproteobacteria bacterium]